MKLSCPQPCPNQVIRNRVLFSIFLAWLILLFAPTFSVAQSQAQFSDADIEFFENKVRPILVQHCLQCHGDDADKLRGGLWLTSRDLMLEGGDSGAAIVPEQPDDSLLIRSVRYEEFEMPPAGQLKDSEIASLVKWVELGAPDPRVTNAPVVNAPIDIEAGKQFWSFQPIANPKPTALPSDWDAWTRTPIDGFVANKLFEAKIEPAADASRAQLIRRAHIALAGLPPTIKQIDAFVGDQAETEIAFASVVDRLLESDHFGQRWGRHWLDVVRFAESSGGGRSLMFKDAWRFRDYVINAFNADKPFDRFVTEQIAGDLMPYDSHDQRNEQLIATGFLALGPTNYEQQDKEALAMEVVDEQVDTVGRAFLGLTLGCARCHDHKFDPIPTSDYYAMAGIFSGTQSLVDGNVSSYVERTLETEQEIKTRKAYRREVERLSKEVAQAVAKLNSLTGVDVNAGAKSQIPKSASLPGIILDNRQAKLVGSWIDSTHLKAFVDAGYIHDDNQKKGNKKAVFSPKITEGGQYEVRMSYNAGGSRASNVPVTVDHQDGKTKVMVNQSATPPIDGLFISLGTFRFEADTISSVTVETTDTDGFVIVDAVQFLKVETNKNQNAKTANSNSKRFESDAITAPVREADEPKKPLTSAKAKKLARVSELQSKILSLTGRLQAIKQNRPPASSVAMSVQDHQSPRDGRIHIRGSVRNLGPVVKRGFISVCCHEDPKPELGDQESGRLQLAQWIASPEHPLTARVYVNRVWRHLFGVGLVETTDNFGTAGRLPSHPDLLDYLANQFIADGWSTKKLIRRIMLSHVYQLSTEFDADAFEKDPSNRLLWRTNRRRVDAEVLRDSILFVSGKLDFTHGGRTIRKLSQYDLGYEFDTVRRSVYVPAFRNSMLDLFEVFDFANPNLVVGHRNTSTLPTQALFLMNSPTVMMHAESAAKRLLAEEPDDRERIALVFRRMLGRYPSEAERLNSLDYVRDFKSKLGSDSADATTQAWTSLCHSLFASLDFRYVE